MTAIFPLPLSDRLSVAAAVVFLLHLEGRRHGGHELDRGRVNVVDDAKGLLPVCGRCVFVCVSRLPLPILSDRVPVVVAVVFLLHLEGRRHGGHDLDRGRVDVVDDAKGLLPVRDCCVVLCVSRLPLPPLPNCVPVAVAAAVALQLHLEGRTSW